jgi:peptide-methionine (S)-S-oxide reductase
MSFNVVKLLRSMEPINLILLAGLFFSCGLSSGKLDPAIHKEGTQKMKTDTVIFASGCFWCSEAVFKELKGVLSATSGYSGGKLENPTYEEVCSGTTGHAEAVQIVFDPDSISFKDLLEVFWKTHDPTTLNRQGADAGTQYRSAIFYCSEEQKKTAEEYKQKLNVSGAFKNPIVTEITAYKNFYPAEDYHQDYYAKNPYQGYCQAVVRPKIEKFRKVFGDKLKGK